VSLDAKLQIRTGQSVAVLYAPGPLDLDAPAASAELAQAVIVFVAKRADLLARMDLLAGATGRGALLWVAYPKAKQLNTDLNRDLIRTELSRRAIDTVRQVALDEVWSALRLKPV
jgi:hypothetical protein